MTERVIVDAGPALNFFSIGKERILLSVAGRIASPETVEREVAGGQCIPDRNTMRKVYEQLRQCDDGLVDIKQTTLLLQELWSRK